MPSSVLSPVCSAVNKTEANPHPCGSSLSSWDTDNRKMDKDVGGSMVRRTMKKNEAKQLVKGAESPVTIGRCGVSRKTWLAS